MADVTAYPDYGGIHALLPGCQVATLTSADEAKTDASVTVREHGLNMQDVQGNTGLEIEADDKHFIVFTATIGTSGLKPETGGKITIGSTVWMIEAARERADNTQVDCLVRKL